MRALRLIESGSRVTPGGSSDSRSRPGLGNSVRADPGLPRITAACVLLAALLVRLLPLGRYVTPDEPAWAYRSIRFADALAARDWTAVPSTGHPGVTTMWLGAAAVAVRQQLDPTASSAHLEWIRRLAWLAPENGEALRHLAVFLPLGRVAVAMVTTLGLLVILCLIARLFEWWIALLTVGLLAFDPFLVGHSGLLHTDALLATFSTISTLCLIVATRDGRRSWAWSLASGTAGGLALLTKSLAAFMPVFVGAVLGCAWLLGRIRLSKALCLTLTWAAACLVVLFALYPAMWGAPARTIRDMFGAPAYQSTTGLMPTFFAGRTALQHGPEFYAVALPFRLSPIVLVGLVLSMRLLFRQDSLRSELAWLWLFAIGYTVLLAASPKKYDRYLLPVFPMLTLAAALGIGSLLGAHTGRLLDRPTGKLVSPSKHRSTSMRIHLLGSRRVQGSTILLILLQLLLLVPFAAYPLTAFNLLLGGPWAAARVLSVDWGEGAGMAARWLNQLPDAGRLTVAAVSVPSFAPLFAGQTVTVKQTSLADYVVSSPDRSSDRPVVYAAHLGFLDHVAVTTNTAPFEQAAYLAAHVEPGDAILLDAETPLLRHYDGPGSIALLNDLPAEADVARRLAEIGVDRTHVWLVADPAAASVTAAHLRRALSNLATVVATDTVGGATIFRFVAHDAPLPPGDAPLATFGEQIRLVDAIMPAAAPDDALPVFLRWQVPNPTSTRLNASAYLRDAAGHLWADVGHLIVNNVNFPTTAWNPGEWADAELRMKRPELIPPGVYAVELTVTDAEGRMQGARDATGQFRGVRLRLGDVEIAPPEKPAGPPACADGQALAAGPFLACIPSLPPQAVHSGDLLVLSVTWSATEPPLVDYAARWRLVDAAGSTILEETADLAPYATGRWRAGDSFEARYDLRLGPDLTTGRHMLALNVLAPDGHTAWEEDEKLTTVEVLARDRLFELPADIAYPLDLTLGDVVHLRGFGIAPLPAVPGVGVLRPGDILDLTLYWQADGPTDLDYTVFVHLVGPDGRPHGQIDRFPGGGAVPTTSWAPGQVVVEEIALPVAANAPAGMYYVAVGLYDATSGGRLPVTDASGQPLPDAQVVLPVALTVTRGEL